MVWYRGGQCPVSEGHRGTAYLFGAKVAGHAAGFLTIREHYEYAAEIHIIGVRPEVHRQGVGRALLEVAEKYLRQRGIEYLQIKTLSPPIRMRAMREPEPSIRQWDFDPWKSSASFGGCRIPA